MAEFPLAHAQHWRQAIAVKRGVRKLFGRLAFGGCGATGLPRVSKGAHRLCRLALLVRGLNVDNTWPLLPAILTPSRGDRRHKPLTSLVLNRTLNHFVHRFLHDNAVARGQRHVGIGQILHVPNELGIEDESFAVESR